MKKLQKMIPLWVGFAALLLVAPVLVNAQVNRSFVSSTGSSSNTATNCQKAAPCRLWSDALTVTNSGGQIVALDDAGFGDVSITKSISLIGTVHFAGFIAPSNVSDVSVNVPGGLVILRSLSFAGAGGATNNTGVSVTSGTVIVDHCYFKGLSKGLFASGSSSSPSNWTRVDINDSDFHGNVVAIDASGPGTETCSGCGFTPAVAQLIVSINGGNFTRNGTGIKSENRGYAQHGTSPNFFYTDLLNVWLFTSTGNQPNSNFFANTANFQCTDANSPAPSNNPCQSSPGTYSTFSQILSPPF